MDEVEVGEEAKVNVRYMFVTLETSQRLRSWLNAAAFWLVPVFATVLMGSFFAPGGPASSGWWSYPPMSLQNPLGHFINGQFLWNQMAWQLCNFERSWASAALRTW